MGSVIVVLFMAGITVVLLYWVVQLIRSILSQRTVRTHCPSCRYDRQSLAEDSKCPECGLTRAEAIAQWRRLQDRASGWLDVAGGVLVVGIVVGLIFLALAISLMGRG